ncbi:MAG: DUF167 domain-containing protein [Pirellulales bacterium]|nr:DUF167 domain-containing protein [Pirellulales bacterium]
MVVVERHGRGVVVAVRAHAGARRNAVVGEREGSLRVAVTAAPEKGKANRAITDVLSKAFGLSKSEVELIAGETSPQKRFLLVGLTEDEAQKACHTILEKFR